MAFVEVTPKSYAYTTGLSKQSPTPQNQGAAGLRRAKHRNQVYTLCLQVPSEKVFGVGARRVQIPSEEVLGALGDMYWMIPSGSTDRALKQFTTDGALGPSARPRLLKTLKHPLYAF